MNRQNPVNANSMNPIINKDLEKKPSLSKLPYFPNNNVWSMKHPRIIQGSE